MKNIDLYLCASFQDLKPENILVSTHNIVKIADFGQACLYFPDEDREYEENVGILMFLQPKQRISKTHTRGNKINKASCHTQER